MPTPHPTYRIRKGDTVQSVTERFGVEESKWIKYHNEKCPITQMILFFIPWDVKEIYLLPELWDKAEQLNQLGTLKPGSIVLGGQNSVLYAPENLSNRYGVILHFPKNKIHYETDCRYKGITPSGVYRIAISRGQVYINDEKPDTMLYEIADRMSKAIYPLELDINRHQRLVAVANYPEIQQRCREVRKNIEQIYAGGYAEKYIRLFGQHYGNPNNLMNHIGNELFFRLLFFPVHGFYDDNLQKKMLYRFSGGKDAPEYHLTVTLEPEYAKSGKMTAHVVSEEMQGGQPCFKADYRLHPEDHSIFWILGERVVTDGDGKPFRMRFEIYHLNPEKRVLKTIIPDYKKFYMKGDDEKIIAPKKTGFWDIFR